MRNRIIDYNVYGSDMQFVAIELGPSESVEAEAGGMMLMEDGIEMETIFGDGSQSSQGLVDKLVSAGQRWLTRESLFMTLFTNTDPEERRVYFAAPYPGKIEAVDLDQVGGELICQKDAFLCAERGVSVGIALQRKLGVGLFGGEGFIMQRLTGNGLAFIHAGGTLHRRTLEYREKLRVDTGCLVAMTRDIRYDIEYVGRMKTALFGGEGLFFATVEGPGTVWLQSLPFSRIANRVLAASRLGRRRRGEGSVLGPLGDLIGGDR